MAGKKSPLRRLEEIGVEERRIEKRLKTLKAERNREVRRAVDEGKTEGQIAKAAGKSPGRINQIKKLRG